MITTGGTRDTARGTIRVFVLPHTHWDREWYQPFEQFRLRLVRLVDHLLDLFDRNPQYSHFMLDGQTVVLEDYLAIRPENESRLRDLVSADKLAVGPWYVLPDEFLVSGEAIVRNLQVGMEVARRFGRPMRVGYLPDSFGHLAQMPQILAGFGFETACLWRGVDDAVPGCEWLWEALDGSQVYVQWLSGGYGNFAAAPEAPQEALERIRREVDRLGGKSRTGVRLLLNGSDHLPPQEFLPALLGAVREAEPTWAVRQASLEEAIAAARAEFGRPGIGGAGPGGAGASPAGVVTPTSALPTVRGELRSAAETSLLPGILSARTYLKLANARSQTLLERWAEPFSALAARVAGLPYPGHFLRHAWKTLLQNHPHDSICGCSVDSVHRQMMARFEQVDQVGEHLLFEAFCALQGEPADTEAPRQASLVVFNPHPWPVQAPFCGEFAFDLEPDQEPTIALLDGNGRPVPCEFEVLERTVRAVNRPGDWPFNVHVARLRVRGLVSLPPLGFEALRIERKTLPGSPGPDLGHGSDWIENGHFRVQAVPGGLHILDKASGIAIGHLFEDTADRGDEYNFCPAEAESPHLSDAGFSWSDIEAVGSPGSVRLRLRGTWHLPAGLPAARRDARTGSAPLDLEMVASLHAGIRRVEFETTVENRHRDHRFRAGFCLPGRIDRTHADTAFGWLTRDSAIPVRDWAEKPVGTHPMVSQVHVDLPDGGRAGIAASGLHEFEAAGSTLYLTLVRSVGWLSRDDLSTRKGDAGPMLATPEAQCPGTHRFRYAWVGQDAADPPGTAMRRGAEFAVPPTVHPSASLPETTSARYLHVEPPALLFSTLKQADSGEGLVLRLFNATGEPCQGDVRVGFPLGRVRAARLDETPGDEVAPRNSHAFPVSLGAFQIGTFLLDA